VRARRGEVRARQRRYAGTRDERERKVEVTNSDREAGKRAC